MSLTPQTSSLQGFEKLKCLQEKRLTLAQRPTPLEALEGCDVPARLWLKRDDLTGSVLSGNKVRKLEFSFGEARARGCDTIITCGAVQSNLCRAATAIARQQGMDVHLLLRGEKPQQGATGNLFLDQLFDADIRYVDADTYAERATLMQQWADDLAVKGRKVFLIPEGASDAIGALGYVDAFIEILQQIKENDLPIDAITVACGSGGTLAGLLLGKAITKSSIEVIGFNVCESAGFFQEKVARICERASERYDLAVRVDSIPIIDGFTDGAYATLGDESAVLLRKMAKEHGIIFDPVYGIKAFRGLCASLKAGALTARNVIFIHTGGIYGCLPYAEQLGEFR